MCSGTSACSVDVNDFLKIFFPCPRELSSYLEASYICLPGTIALIFLNLLFLYIYFVNLYSYADQDCSGRVSCDLDVHDFIKLFHPCPRELSSYLEASYICMPGKLIQLVKQKQGTRYKNVNLHSFADNRCSGTSGCHIKVHEFLEKFYPCPRELSSYLEASYLCLPGNASLVFHYLSKYLTMWICTVLQMEDALVPSHVK